ncbi:GNAT family N-acetyltransferase [Gottschalkiaceae bacterium SANA]|nr:GNAT family N-acetyltransferase [Gottschalkiaceae bacterium SANA]
MDFITIDTINLDQEHLCCALADKKHQIGVAEKKKWLADRVQEGHIFRKLNVRGKVFIEYAPLETAWTPIVGENYLYIYCLWVSGKFKGQGYAKELLRQCIEDAKSQNKSGICILSSKKKKPFLSDKKFLIKQGFFVADTADPDYELLALSFDGSRPRITKRAKEQKIDSQNLTIFFSPQCPCIPNCIKQIENYCSKHHIPLDLIPIDSLEKAKKMPSIFNNWAVFYKGTFQTVHLLNENYLKKLLASFES